MLTRASALANPLGDQHLRPLSTASGATRRAGSGRRDSGKRGSIRRVVTPLLVRPLCR